MLSIDVICVQSNEFSCNQFVENHLFINIIELTGTPAKMAISSTFFLLLSLNRACSRISVALYIYI